MKTNMAFLKGLIPAFLLVAFTVAGCGGEKNEGEQPGNEGQTNSADASGTEATVDNTAAETGEVSGNAGDYLAINREIVGIMKGIHSEADVKAAEPKLDRLYTDLIRLLKENANNPDAMQSMTGAQEIQALNDAQSVEIERIAKESPMASVALGLLIAKHAGPLMEMAGEAMKQVDRKELQKAMEEVRKHTEGK